MSEQLPGQTSMEALRALAERALTHPQSADRAHVPAIPHLLPGQLPPNLPAPIPLPKGSHLLGSVVKTRGSMPEEMVAGICLDVPGTSNQIYEFFREHLPPAGWHAVEEEADQDTESSGFIRTRPSWRAEQLEFTWGTWRFEQHERAFTGLFAVVRRPWRNGQYRLEVRVQPTDQPEEEELLRRYYDGTI